MDDAFYLDVIGSIETQNQMKVIAYIHHQIGQTKARGKSLLESWGITFLADWQPLQNQMSTSHTIRAHALRVGDKSDKDVG